MNATDRSRMRALAREIKGYSRAARRAVMAAEDAERRLKGASGPWYHGTPDRDFDKFDPNLAATRHGTGSIAGIFFTNSRAQGDNFRRLALKYSDTPRDKHDGRVIEALIRGRFKPVDVPSLERQRSSRRAENPYALGKQRDWMLQETARARREGFDGVDFINILDDPLVSRNRATHRVVFSDRVADNVDILHSHVKAPAGALEETIADARAARAAITKKRQPKRQPQRSRRPFYI